ncbi:hypothetical protein BH11BAC1_BH11BAC1_19300 [soil metagenome]
MKRQDRYFAKLTKVPVNERKQYVKFCLRKPQNKTASLITEKGGSLYGLAKKLERLILRDSEFNLGDCFVPRNDYSWDSSSQ